jgi:hypothetical protein
MYRRTTHSSDFNIFEIAQRELDTSSIHLLINIYLFCQLLCFNPRERLGHGMNGAEDIKSHPFFHGINWHNMENP